jgi:hypothetical protein
MTRARSHQCAHVGAPCQLVLNSGQAALEPLRTRNVTQ